MANLGLRAVDRRAAVAGALAGATALALPLPVSGGRVVVQRGMIGGGLVESGESEAHFSLFASRLSVEGENQEVVVGSVLWVDVSTGLTMSSTSITGYSVPEVQPDQGESREIVGIMSVNGEGEYPFELEVIDADLPGSGLDSVSLTVGDRARAGASATPASGFGFNYSAEGTVVSGDIQEVHLDIDLR
ncbi:MAG: hypothetical protein KY456_16810 [Chloroflexi bacterium]|nr:hypothetical protein [Chloroflexota bacterium]